LTGEEGVGTGAQFPLSKWVKKAPISRQTLRHFSTLDLTQVLSKHFINLLTPQPHVVFRPSTSLGLLNNKIEKS